MLSHRVESERLGVAGEPSESRSEEPAKSARARIPVENRFDLQCVLSSRLADLGRPDVVILNDCPPLLGQRALTGQRIFIRDETAYVRYFIRTLSMAEDERPWRCIHQKARHRRLEEGNFGRS